MIKVQLSFLDLPLAQLLVLPIFSEHRLLALQFLQILALLTLVISKWVVNTDILLMQHRHLTLLELSIMIAVLLYWTLVRFYQDLNSFRELSQQCILLVKSCLAVPELKQQIKLECYLIFLFQQVLMT